MPSSSVLYFLYMLTLLYFIFVQASLLIPGYTVLVRTKLFSKKPGVELCLGYLVSILLFSILALSSYILNIPHLWIQLLSWSALVVSILLFWRDKLFLKLKDYRFPLAALVIMSLFAQLFISLPMPSKPTFIPDPQPIAGRDYKTLNVKVLNVAQTNANDNYIPYRQAQFIVNRSDPGKDGFIDEWGVHFFQRTPLMGSVSANFFIMLGDKPPIGYTWANDSHDSGRTYQKFQIIAQILNCLFVLPAFLLLTRFFNRQTASTALLFIIPSQFFLFNAFFTWPKSFVAFFILLSWLLIYENSRRYTFAAGIASGLAYLTHDLSVLYIGTTCVLLIMHKRWRDSLLVGACSALFAIPWLMTATFKYSKPSTFFYYPFSTSGIPQVTQKKQILHTFFATSPFKLIGIRIQNIFYQLSPYQLLFSEGGQAIGRRFWAFGLFSVPGAIGGGLIIPTILGGWRKLATKDLWILILAPVVFCSLIIGWPKGLGALHFAQPSVVLLIGLACHYLLRLGKRAWLELCFLINVLQTLFFMLYSYNFTIADWFTTIRGLILTTSILSIILGCYIALRKMKHTPSAVRV